MTTHNEGAGGPALRTSNGFFHPDTNLAREEVRNELRKILGSPAFQNSKRYASVLKYIVDQTLAGNGDRLKERTIGIEVFHRPPDYDTATNHSVRSAVGEVRKRLAQHYQQNLDSRVRIEVLPGSYMAQFRCTEEYRLLTLAAPDTGSKDVVPPDTIPNQTSPAADCPAPDHSIVQGGDRRTRMRTRWLTFAALILISFTSLLFLVAYTRADRPLESFWKPILSSRAPVLLCIGDMEGGRGSPEAYSNLSPTLTISDFQNSPFETASVYDAIAMAKFTGLLEANGRQFRLKSQSDATFADLQNGPTILVGLLNNNWTERLMPKLRFTFEQASGKVTIRDRNNASRKDWSVDYATPYLDVTKDYALVLRMVDPKTEQMVVVAAGITVFGTSAAGDFLTSKNEIRKLAAIAPPDWEKKNIEIVLSTDVIRGKSGPASIVATQFW